jgi:DNA polymerase elongation subunit (family B)
LGYLFENENKEKCLKTKTIYNDDETALLHEFISLTDKFYKLHKRIVFAGHNIREFDIPYLCRRMLIQNLPLPAYLQLHGAKPWEVNMVDTLQWWKFGDYKNFISLHLLASVLNIPTSKDDIDGSMVQHVYYKEKNLPRIAQYCQKDIIVVANILLRFQNLLLLQNENIFIAE